MLLRYCVKKDTMATPVSKVIDISGGSFVYCLQKDKRVRLRRKLSACYHPRLPAAQIIPFVFLNHFLHSFYVSLHMLAQHSCHTVLFIPLLSFCLSTLACKPRIPAASNHQVKWLQFNKNWWWSWWELLIVCLICECKGVSEKKNGMNDKKTIWTHLKGDLLCSVQWWTPLEAVKQKSTVWSTVCRSCPFKFTLGLNAPFSDWLPLTWFLQTGHSTCEHPFLSLARELSALPKNQRRAFKNNL